MSRRAWLWGGGIAVAAAAFLLFGRPLDALDLPTTEEPEGVGMQALYEGQVLGDVRTGCLTLESGSLIMWPKGFYALDNPPRVMRARRNVAVAIGDEVRMGGGHVEGAPICGTTNHWIVSEVETSFD